MSKIVKAHREIDMDSADVRERNNFLMAAGYGKLDDPNLIHQLAMAVQDHSHFGEIIRAVPPEQRTEAYEAMRPYLHFEPLALDRYLIVTH